jgi:hypothetical protein
LVALAVTASLTNHLTGGLLLPAVLAFVVISLLDRRGRTPPAPVPIGRSVVAALLPLLLYLYLPLRGLAVPAVAWDYPTTWHRFLIHVSARQYQGLLGREGLRFAELQRFFSQQLPEEAGWLFVALAGLGLLALLARHWRLGLVALLAAAAFVVYNMAYPIHDLRLYYIPTLALIGLWAALGAGVLAAISQRMHTSAALAVSLALCAACVVPLSSHWRDNDQSDFQLLAFYTRDTLKHLDEDAIIFSGRWDRFSSASLYYQNVEKVRPDVVVLDLQSLARVSLERYLQERAPELAEACRVELESVREIAVLAELGRPYDVAEGRFRFARLKRRLVERAVELRSTYATSDLYRHSMFKGYALLTEGLVTRVVAEDYYRPFPIPRFEGPGILRAEVRNEVEREIWLEYGRMLRNRGRYLERHGRELEAELVAEKARLLSR